MNKGERMKKLSENALKYVKNIGFITLGLIVLIAALAIFAVLNTGSNGISHYIDLLKNAGPIISLLNLDQSAWYQMVVDGIHLGKVFYVGVTITLIVLYVVTIFAIQLIGAMIFKNQYKKEKKSLFPQLIGASLLVLAVALVSKQTASGSWIAILIGGGTLYNVLNVFLLILILSQIVLVIIKIALMIKNNEYETNYVLIDLTKFFAVIALVVTIIKGIIYTIVYTVVTSYLAVFEPLKRFDVSQAIASFINSLFNFPDKLVALGQNIPYGIINSYGDRYIDAFLTTQATRVYNNMLTPIILLAILIIVLLVIIGQVKHKKDTPMFAGLYLLLAACFGFYMIFNNIFIFANLIGYIVLIVTCINLYEAMIRHGWLTKIKQMLKK